MQWRLIKIGAEMFDMLHAYGLGILLAKATMEPIELVDQGHYYTLFSPSTHLPCASLDLLDELFVLPPKSDEQPGNPNQPIERKKTAFGKTPDLPLANFDGLLTVLFTSPGGRFLSVADVLQKQQRNTSTMTQAIDKATNAFLAWKRYTLQTLQREK